MTYELKDNLAIYHLCRTRPVFNPDRCHSLSIVWPARPASVPAIPLNEYERERDKVFARNDAANCARAKMFADELNAKRKT
jgi:hypothetical protein